MAKTKIEYLIHSWNPIAMRCTKRPKRMVEIFGECTIPNIWFGVSAENQKRFDERVPELLKMKSRNLFVSLEPLLEPIDLEIPYGQGVGELILESGKLNWVIVSCETGQRRRPCNIEWIRSIARQCQDAGVPVFIKQIELNGKIVHDINQFPEDLRLRQTPWGSKEVADE
jgi:protein gp37